jgi:hypothetical protein
MSWPSWRLLLAFVGASLVLIGGMVFVRDSRRNMNAAVALVLGRDDLPPDDGCYEPLGDEWGYRLRLEWRDPGRADEVWRHVRAAGMVGPWTTTELRLRGAACAGAEASRAVVVRENGDQFFALRCATGLVQVRVDRLSSTYDAWPFGDWYPLGMLAPGACR